MGRAQYFFVTSTHLLSPPGPLLNRVGGGLGLTALNSTRKTPCFDADDFLFHGFAVRCITIAACSEGDEVEEVEGEEGDEGDGSATHPSRKASRFLI